MRSLCLLAQCLGKLRGDEAIALRSHMAVEELLAPLSRQLLDHGEEIQHIEAASRRASKYPTLDFQVSRPSVRYFRLREHEDAGAV